MYRRQPHVFKMPLLGRGFYTLARNAQFSSPTDVGSHNIDGYGTMTVNHMTYMKRMRFVNYVNYRFKSKFSP